MRKSIAKLVRETELGPVGLVVFKRKLSALSATSKFTGTYNDVDPKLLAKILVEAKGAQTRRNSQHREQIKGTSRDRDRDRRRRSRSQPRRHSSSRSNRKRSPPPPRKLAAGKSLSGSKAKTSKRQRS